MQNKHLKHTKLVKPNGGKFHRNEWTVIGAPCSVLKDFVSKLSAELALQNISTGYMDMAHQSEDLSGSASATLEDKIDHWILKSKSVIKERAHRKLFDHLDLLFVNGNHYSGEQQIVFVSQEKKESLQRKLDRLTEVKLFVLDEGNNVLHNYLESYNDGSIQILKLGDTKIIAEQLSDDFKSKIPKLNGLVLNGGKSQRMGAAKGDIRYQNKTQKEVEADLLSRFCNQTYYSLSTKSKEDSDYETILDSFSGLGPYGGILSAFRQNPNCAWLTVACDLPYMDEGTIAQLVQARNPSKLATCFYNPETDFPEPLITIWEPRAYPVLLDFLSQGYSCPRKALINSNISMIQMQDPTQMKNVNTPEQRAEAEAYLKNI